MIPRSRALVVGFGAVMALAGAGCGAVQPVSSANTPGTTSIRIVNNVGGAYSLAQVFVRVDDDAIPITAVPPRGAQQVTTLLKLSPGDHTLAVRASAAAAPGADGVLVVGSHQSFHVGVEPAALVVHVYSRPPNDEAGTALGLDVAMGGGGVLVNDLAEGGDARCSGRSPVKLALCHAAIMFEDATRSRDVVRAACVGDKLDKMHDLLDIASTPRKDVKAAAESKIIDLEREIETCKTSLTIDDDAVTPR